MGTSASPWCEDVRNDAKKAGCGEMQDDLYAYFLSRVIANLHIVLCMSPIGEGFRERCRMFPGRGLRSSTFQLNLSRF